MNFFLQFSDSWFMLKLTTVYNIMLYITGRCLYSMHIAVIHIVLQTGTVILRLAVFPLFIYVQRNMILMNNHMPIVQKLQEQFNRARRRGDMLEGMCVAAVMCTL